jgi:hypothetical protein
MRSCSRQHSDLDDARNVVQRQSYAAMLVLAIV